MEQQDEHASSSASFHQTIYQNSEELMNAHGSGSFGGG